MVSGRGPRIGLVAVLLLAGLARLAVMAPRINRPADDPDNYLPLAHGLARGDGFQIQGRPTAYRPPLYPIVLAPLVGTGDRRFNLPVAGLHLALGLLTVALTALAARRLGFGPGRALIAATLVALDPVLVVQSRSVMTETLAAFLLAAALAALADGRERGAALGGLAFGLAALCRPSTLPAAGLSALAALVAPPGSIGPRLRRASLLVTLTTVPLLPWALRNRWVLGEAVWTTTHGGYTLALANNPIYYDEVVDGPPGAVWQGPGQRAWFEWANRAADRMPEPQADRTLRDAALRVIAERPATFCRASIARLGRFWALAPSSAVYPRPLRLLTALWTGPFWIALVAGLARRASWRWPAVAAVMIVLALSLVHALFWTDLRMRAPIVPALALIAAGAVAGPPRAGKKT